MSDYEDLTYELKGHVAPDHAEPPGAPQRAFGGHDAQHRPGVSRLAGQRRRARRRRYRRGAWLLLRRRPACAAGPGGGPRPARGRGREGFRSAATTCAASTRRRAPCRRSTSRISPASTAPRPAPAWTSQAWPTSDGLAAKPSSRPLSLASASSPAMVVATTCRASSAWRRRWSCFGPAASFDADEALSMGYVTRVIDNATLLDETLAFAAGDRLAAADCRAVHQAAVLSEHAHRPRHVPAHVAVHADHRIRTEDAAEGPRAFREKRKPVFKGR